MGASPVQEDSGEELADDISDDPMSSMKSKATAYRLGLLLATNYYEKVFMGIAEDHTTCAVLDLTIAAAKPLMLQIQKIKHDYDEDFHVEACVTTSASASHEHASSVIVQM